MDILTLAYDKTIAWVGGIGHVDYIFVYRLFMLYVCAFIAASFSLRMLEIRQAPMQWSIALVAALASFNVPVIHPTREAVVAYMVIIGSMLLLGAVGMLSLVVVETRLKQRRLRRIFYSTLLVLVLTHLVVRRYLS